MLVVGQTDAFEQDYMAKFEQLATHYGVFVKYERDRAARDIGLHLTKGMRSGGRQVTNSLVWFQMKGVMASTLTKEQFESADSVKLSLDVEHLRHWFLDEEPTHLVVYVESVGQFLVLNLQEYIAKTWGREILTLEQKTATIAVPVSSVLDEQAFSILLRYADIAQWAKALGTDYDEARLINRDYNLIYSVGTAEGRAVDVSVMWVKWLSKMRHELRVAERPHDYDGDIDDGWRVIHEHWEYGGIDPEDSYPYLELFAIEDLESESLWDDEELDEDGEIITLKNGDDVFGYNIANEYCNFIFGARLNEYGGRLFGHVEALVKMGLLELRDPDDKERTFLSIAPWHHRSV